MTLVTRYPLVSRVESEVNNALRSSLLGSDSTSGLYKQRGKPIQLEAIIRSSEDSLCCIGVMSAITEGDPRSVKRFPSQQNFLESVK